MVVVGVIHHQQLVRGAVDSGTFFRAGTTEMVAQIIQFGLECEDKALHALLEEAMAEAKVPPLGG